jgi:hypothetical protein
VLRASEVAEAVGDDQLEVLEACVRIFSQRVTSRFVSALAIDEAIRG